MLEIALVLMVALSIGSNEESFSILLASKSMKLKVILLLGGVTMFLGAFLFGNIVSETLREDITTGLNKKAEIAILLGMVLWMIVSWVFKWPVSTTTSVVGSILGFSLMSGAPINLKSLIEICVSWFLSPLAGLLFAFLLYSLLIKLLLYFVKGFGQREALERFFSALLVVFTFLAVFSRSANDIANAVFLYAARNPVLFLFLGGAGLSLGFVLFGARLTKNVGVGLTKLTPSAGFCAMLSSFLVVSAFTWVGMPISSSSVFVSSIAGAGLARRQPINKKLFTEMIISWVITLPLCALLSGILYLVL